MIDFDGILSSDSYLCLMSFGYRGPEAGGSDTGHYRRICGDDKSNEPSPVSSSNAHEDEISQVLKLLKKRTRTMEKPFFDPPFISRMLESIE